MQVMMQVTTNKNPLTPWSSISKGLNRMRKLPKNRAFIQETDAEFCLALQRPQWGRNRGVGSPGCPRTTDLFSGSSPSFGSTVAAWGSRGERVCGPQPAPEAPAPPSSADLTSSPPRASPPVPPGRPVSAATRPVGTLTRTQGQRNTKRNDLSQRMFSFNFPACPKNRNKLRLTDRVVSRSGLCQHMEQRGIVGQGGHVQGDQALIADPVHSFLPLSLPLLVLLLAASTSSAPAAGVLPGEQALHGQGVFILHRLPQGLVLAASAKKRTGV